RRSLMKISNRNALVAIALLGLVRPAAADIISDWNDRTVEFVVAHAMGPPPAERVIAMTHLAMFDAIDAIERRYNPYLVQIPAAKTASKEAAAAAAAAAILAAVDPKAAPDMKAALAASIATIADSDAKIEGIKLGEAVAAKILEARANDGANAADTYR